MIAALIDGSMLPLLRWICRSDHCVLLFRRGLLVVACAFTSMAAADGLLRDQQLILKLLRHGEVNLNPPVARELPSSESELRIRRVGLSAEGHSIRAAFRDKTRRVSPSRDVSVRYVDAWYNEVAAYHVATALGLDFVPPTVVRELHIAESGLGASEVPRRGSLQYWVENSVVEYELKTSEQTYPGDPLWKNWQLSEIVVFDCVIGNVDRHAGNILVDLNPRYPRGHKGGAEPVLGKLWAIDHSRAFHRDARIVTGGCRIERLARQPVSLTFIRGLRRWDPTALETQLRAAGLSQREVDNLHLQSLNRRLAKVLERLEARRAESGLAEEDFFSHGRWHELR